MPEGHHNAPTLGVKGWIYKDGLKPIAETDASGNIVSLFVYGTSALSPDYMVRDGATYRFIRDIQGSVRLVVNAATGAVAQRLDYDSFGRMLADTNPGFQPFGFQSGLYDPDTGLVQFGARWYDAATGCWLSKDPILLEGGLNLYAFCGNDPVNYVDPLGLCEGTLSEKDRAMLSIVSKYFPTAYKNQTEMTGYFQKNPESGLYEISSYKPHFWSQDLGIRVGTADNAPIPGISFFPSADSVWHFHVIPRENGVGQGMSGGDVSSARFLYRITSGRVDTWYHATTSGSNVNIYRWDISPYAYDETDSVLIGSMPLP